MKQHSFIKGVLLSGVIMMLGLCSFIPIHASGASVEINEQIGGDTTMADTSEEPEPPSPSEDLAAPKESEILLRRFPETGEQRTYLILIVGSACLLLFIFTKLKKRSE